MKHLGDITKISGYSIPPVDVITFGSPCQDLSIAGKRAGMAGERSGLFTEAVRIIKEMRYATFGAYPKYAIWENVLGAYSSNKGEDFHAVIESLCQIVNPDAVIPRPKDARGGISKWPHQGLIMGDHFSLAWRTLDAQYWGVPQRRMRIALVADFTGQRAGEILFEPESLRGHFAPGVTPRQGIAGVVETSADRTDAADAIPINLQLATRHNALGERTGLGIGVSGDPAFTILAWHEHGVCCQDSNEAKAFSFDSLASNSMKSANPHSGCREVDVAKTIDTSYPDPSKNQGGIAVVERVKAYTLKIRSGCEGGGKGALVQTEKSATLSTLQDQTLFQPVTEPVYCIQGNTIDRADTAGANGKGIKEDVCYTLNTIDRPAVVYDARGNGDGKTVPTITGDHNSRVSDYSSCVLEECAAAVDLYNGAVTGSHTCAITASIAKGASMTCPSVIETIEHNANNSAVTLEGQQVVSTLQARDFKGVGRCDTFGRVIAQHFRHWIVRRLTPLECERLQGFPDGWTDIGEWTDSKGKVHKYADAPRYKALGNSIALPQWFYVLGGIADRLPEDATLGSLFDGIGGFPYVWAVLHNNNKVLCVWASEIEEFPIAVTKKWFPEVNDGELL